MPQHADIMEWRGCEVIDQDGDKVGKLDEIYLDQQTGKPEWAIVNTGLFGRKSSFVPLKDALREGEIIRVPYQTEQIKDAPKVDPDGQISPEEEQQVYAHYGLEYSQERSGSGLPEGGAPTTGGQAGQAGQAGEEGQTRQTGDSAEQRTQAGDPTQPGDSTQASDPTQAGSRTEGQGGEGGEGSGLRLRRFVREEVRIDDGPEGNQGDAVETTSVREEERVISQPRNED